MGNENIKILNNLMNKFLKIQITSILGNISWRVLYEFAVNDIIPISYKLFCFIKIVEMTVDEKFCILIHYWIYYLIETFLQTTQIHATQFSFWQLSNRKLQCR